MATITGFTAERMLVIENETVVDGEVVGNNLHLLTREGTVIDAGNVRGPKGDTGPTGPLTPEQADSTYVNLIGDHMIGDLIIDPGGIGFGARLGEHLKLYDSGGATPSRFTMGVQVDTLYSRTNSVGSFAWYQGGVHSDAQNNSGGGKTIMRTSGAGSFIIGESMSSVTPLVLVGPSGNCYMPFYCEGDQAITRSGYIGFPTSPHLFIRNERPNGFVNITANNGGIIFSPNAIEAARFLSGGNLLLGKTVSSFTAQDGFELEQSGRVFVTSSVNQHNVALNKRSSSNANGATYQSFYADGTIVGTITRNGSGVTGGVSFNTTSDYRLKNVLGPVNDSMGRLKRLRPVHFSWKGDSAEQDGFLAHEVAEIVPDAVTGEKDALTEDGEISPQGLDNTRLIPLLTAALQQALDRIDDLENRIATLEAA